MDQLERVRNRRAYRAWLVEKVEIEGETFEELAELIKTPDVSVEDLAESLKADYHRFKGPGGLHQPAKGQ